MESLPIPFTGIDPHISEPVTPPAAPPEHAAPNQPQVEQKFLGDLPSPSLDGASFPANYCIHTQNPPRAKMPESRDLSSTPRRLPTVENVETQLSHLSLNGHSQLPTLQNGLSTGQSGDPTGLSVTASSSPGNPSGSHTGKRKAAEREWDSSDSREDEDSNDDGDQDGREYASNPSQGRPNTTGFRFGCPYHKREPERFNCTDHHKCLKPFANIGKVKAHVKDCHTTSDHPDGVGPEAVEIMNGRKNNNKVNTWEGLCAVLFPSDDEIPSPDYESCPRFWKSNLERLESNLVRDLEQRKLEFYQRHELTQGSMERFMQDILADIKRQFRVPQQCGMLPQPIRALHLQMASKRRANGVNGVNGANGGVLMNGNRSNFPTLAPRLAANQHAIQPQSMPQVGYQSILPYNNHSSVYTPTALPVQQNNHRPMSEIARPSPLPHLATDGLAPNSISQFSTLMEYTSEPPASYQASSYSNLFSNSSTSPVHGDQNGAAGYTHQGNAMYDQNQSAFLNWQEQGFLDNPSAEPDDFDL